jgi:hypothetical protein
MKSSHVFEIYTSNPATGETGWDIEWVRATRSDIEQYPNFDCIITMNDYPMTGDRDNIIDFEV